VDRHAATDDVEDAEDIVVSSRRAFVMAGYVLKMFKHPHFPEIPFLRIWASLLVALVG
jgi:hypothetical protein